jgi:cell division protein FtsL
MQWFHRSDLWLSILLAGGILVTSITVIETAYQTRQLYSALQDLRAERDRLTIEWGRLMLERSAVSADMRIDAMARSSLSLSAPPMNDVMLLERPQ